MTKNYLTKDEAIDFLNDQKKVVELKPKRKVYFENRETIKGTLDGNTDYYLFNDLNEVYFNGIELKYWDKYGNSKRFTDEELQTVKFQLEDENTFKRRLEFNEELNEILGLN